MYSHPDSVQPTLNVLKDSVTTYRPPGDLLPKILGPSQNSPP